MSIELAQSQEIIDHTLTQSEEDLGRTASLSQLDQEPPGVAVGFELIRPLGQGAFGTVWLAKERKTGRLAAVKFFTRLGHDWALLGREVEKLAALDTSHHIVGLIDVGWDATPPYYVMEYLPHGSLNAYLAGGAIPVAEAVRIGGDVLRGLIHAHGSGILHCDLKPGNVLLDSDLQARLCDFGQSRLSAEERPALGTLFYMPPEQADLKAMPDVRWDVYALGALLYQMLTGTPPHRTLEAENVLAACETTTERLEAYRSLITRLGPPTDHRKVQGVDRRLGDIIERCLAPNPSDRFPNSQAVLDAFQAREEYRRQRSLIALGLIGPLLLLAAMTPFFLTAMRNAEATAKDNLIERALESDALSARLLSRSLERELSERIDGVERVAANERFRQIVEQADVGGWADRSAVGEYLESVRKDADSRREKLRLTKDTSWFLTDARGIQRWRDPYNAKTHDRDFSWKDYFHGRGVEYDEQPGGMNPVPPGIGPIERSLVSIVFRSDATGHYMIAVVTPIFSVDGSRVIGVLGRTQHLWELLADYELTASPDRDGVEQILALVDRRDKDWRLIAHPWLTSQHVKELSDADVSKLTVSPEDVTEIAQKLGSGTVSRDGRAAQLDDYNDPIGRVGFAPKEFGGTWLAAIRPVAETGWLAIVQERRSSAITPAERMRSDLLMYVLAALAVGGGLILTFWYFVTQALTDRSTTPQRAVTVANTESHLRERRL